MGIYIFGGEKENHKPTNELFIIRAIEKKPISLIKFSPSTIECFKPAIAGRPPIPRTRHSCAFISNKFLAIYGGYNTILGIKIINDLILLNLCIFL